MDQFGFCALAIVPVRAEASERSEMVNQLLFGETFEVIDRFNGWNVIRGSLDSYEGFIDEKQCICVSGEEYERLQAIARIFPKELVSRLTDTSTKSKFNILFGSPLPAFDAGVFRMGTKEYHFDGEFTKFFRFEGETWTCFTFYRNIINQPLI